MAPAEDKLSLLDLPWRLPAALPLLSSAQPGRLVVYAFLLIAVITARWLARPRRPALREAVEQVRRQPVPLEALARTLAAAERLEAAPVPPRRRFGRRLVLTAAAAALVLLGVGLWLARPTASWADVAKAVQDWIGAVGAKTAYITPGSPWENGFSGSASMRGKIMRNGPGNRGNVGLKAGYMEGPTPVNQVPATTSRFIIRQ